MSLKNSGEVNSFEVEQHFIHEVAFMGSESLTCFAKTTKPSKKKMFLTAVCETV